MALGEHKICCYIRMQTNKQTQKLWKRAINKLENELHHWNIIYIFTLWHYNWKFINKKKENTYIMLISNMFLKYLRIEFVCYAGTLKENIWITIDWLVFCFSSKYTFFSPVSGVFHEKKVCFLLDITLYP